MKAGAPVTVSQINEKLRKLYKSLNGILPNIALSITSKQLVQYDGSMFPSKYGLQYFKADDDDLLTNAITKDIEDALNEED